VPFRISIDRLDANIEEITIGPWMAAEGDRVELGQPLVEIISDKITFDYESEAAGVLRVIVAPERSVVPVHYVIGVIAEPGESLPDYEEHNAALLARARQGLSVGEAAPAAGTAPEAAAGRVRATPAARRRARELGIDIAAVAAEGKGVVQVEDVERRAAGGDAPC
jgi:pyruvate/2-oxoglutarate dehydrogenase complex dihydrolipoamide acyltransferase (E2) component